jgi:DNA-binding transcriptional LysR family regulator
MYLRFVEVFCEVAQRRSFSKGATALDVSQSSASQAVSLLEKRLGTQLIDRSKRPLELTPAGELYFDGCRELLERFRAIEDRVQSIQDRVAGPVRVAAIYSVGLMQMEQSVQRFEELYPDARLRLEYLHPDRVYQQLMEDEADVGLVSYPRHGGDFESIDWQEQPMVLVVPPQHRLAGRHSVEIAELNGEDYVGFTQELTIRREVDRQLKRSRVAVQVVHEFDNIETIKRAIEIDRAFEYVRETNREISTGREIKELKTLRSVGFARGVETFARGDTRLAVNIDNWDRNPFLLGTPGGTVDLRTGELRPSDPADGITKIAGVAPSTHTDSIAPGATRFPNDGR